MTERKGVLTNEEILKGLRAGDDQIRNEVCRSLAYTLVARFSRLHKADIEDIKDLFSDTFLYAEKWIRGNTREAKGKDFQGDFIALLYCIMLRLRIKQFKRIKKSQEIINTLKHDLESLNSFQINEDLLSLELNKIAYQECLEHLPESQKRLISDLFSVQVEYRTNEDRRKILNLGNMNDYYSTKSQSLKNMLHCLENNYKYDPLI